MDMDEVRFLSDLHILAQEKSKKPGRFSEEQRWQKASHGGGRGGGGGNLLGEGVGEGPLSLHRLDLLRVVRHAAAVPRL